MAHVVFQIVLNVMSLFVGYCMLAVLTKSANTTVLFKYTTERKTIKH